LQALREAFAKTPPPPPATPAGAAAAADDDDESEALPDNASAVDVTVVGDAEPREP
jgi:hypothetical protein